MRKIGFLGAAALLGAVACDSVLDIDEPITRPEQSAGEGGEPPATTAGTNSGGMSKGLGGSAGEGATAPLLGGAAGHAGEMGEAGAAGAPTPKDCEPDARRCTELAPEICDETGHWVANSEEADGNCTELCVAGKCAECKDGDRRCSICEEGDQNCLPSLPQTCVDGAWHDADTACKAYCDVGTGKCVQPPSCTDGNVDGTTCKAGVSCCMSLLVPGGPFFRNFDNDEYAEQNLPATVSAFYLDRFEVTVGRFKQFLLGYAALELAQGAGKATHVDDDQGWSGVQLPTKTDLVASLVSCDGTTWSDTLVPADDKLPVNCVPFDVAYAFCIWDGGRLPTETEWNFAAAGGDDQRVYPWKAPLAGPPISAAFANYGDANPGPVSPGLTPAGDGRWGHSDLAGNVIEWTLDYWRSDLPESCSDCVNATASGERVVRGGYFHHDEYGVKVAFRSSAPPETRHSAIGFRCARDVK